VFLNVSHALSDILSLTASVSPVEETKKITKNTGKTALHANLMRTVSLGTVSPVLKKPENMEFLKLFLI